MKYLRGKKKATFLTKGSTLWGRWFVLEVHVKIVIFLNIEFG
jgi:hypothetical protein